MDLHGNQRVLPPLPRRTQNVIEYQEHMKRILNPNNTDIPVPMTTKHKVTEPDKIFQEIRGYLKQSGAINGHKLIHWAQTQDDKTKYRVTTHLFRQQYLKQLIE